MAEQLPTPTLSISDTGVNPNPYLTFGWGEVLNATGYRLSINEVAFIDISSGILVYTYTESNAANESGYTTGTIYALGDGVDWIDSNVSDAVIGQLPYFEVYNLQGYNSGLATFQVGFNWSYDGSNGGSPITTGVYSLNGGESWSIINGSPFMPNASGVVVNGVLGGQRIDVRVRNNFQFDFTAANSGYYYTVPTGVDISGIVNNQVLWGTSSNDSGVTISVYNASTSDGEYSFLSGPHDITLAYADLDLAVGTHYIRLVAIEPNSAASVTGDFQQYTVTWIAITGDPLMLFIAGLSDEEPIAITGDLPLYVKGRNMSTVCIQKIIEANIVSYGDAVVFDGNSAQDLVTTPLDSGITEGYMAVMNSVDCLLPTG